MSDEIKVRVRPTYYSPNDTRSRPAAYVVPRADDPHTADGTWKHTDEPVVVHWDGREWVEVQS